MIIKNTETVVNGGITTVRVTIQQDEYLDDKGTQELVSQMKQYADRELGGN